VAMREAMKEAETKLKKLTKEEWVALLQQEVDPLYHAGEGVSDTEEIPRAQDIRNKFLRARRGREGEYPPGPRRMNRGS